MYYSIILMGVVRGVVKNNRLYLIFLLIIKLWVLLVITFAITAFTI